jgi:hypothetical protein
LFLYSTAAAAGVLVRGIHPPHWCTLSVLFTLHSGVFPCYVLIHPSHWFLNCGCRPHLSPPSGLFFSSDTV